MKIVFSKNPINILNSRSTSSSSLFLFHFPSNVFRSRSFVLSSSRKWTLGTKSLKLSSSPLRASCAPSSTVYGGWDEVAVAGDSDSLRSFLASIGIDDRKNVFVFILGLVCAMAISRVRVSSIIVIPASALVFAVGFVVGFFRSGAFGDARISGTKRKDKDENSKQFSEKLRSLLEFFDELDGVVNNLKSDVQFAIRNKKIEESDFFGYVDVTDKIKLKALNARNIVKALIDNEGNSNGAFVENNKGSRRKKDAGEAGYQMLQSIGSLFGEKSVTSNSNKVRENAKQETVDRALDQAPGNGTVPPVEDKASNSDSRGNGKLDSSLDSSIRSVSDMYRNGRTKGIAENDDFGLGGVGRKTNKFRDEKEYSYRNKGLRFTNNRSFSLKMDSSSVTDMWESHDNLLDSESMKVRMEHRESESSFVQEQLLNQGRETFTSSYDKRDDEPHRSPFEEDAMNYDHRNQHHGDDLPGRESEFNASSSAKTSDDEMFGRFLAEATELQKQAKVFIKARHDEEQAEIMLYRSANLFSKALDLKPMSLLAVGQLGNTYLLHGELKLKISRELRGLLSGSIQPSSGRRSRVLKGMRKKITSKEEVAPLLIDVCEECEELLVEAGRKYRLALSIDANDVRALYNWGLALSFRGQLIADIGPGAAFEAERVFLAAIDKFDAMLLKGNVYAPDALFRWGVALQQRSRLRPGTSKEKVKLLQQARRLYEDALHMDSNNMQAKEALSSCLYELNYR
ncbi:hypothetical protein HN51_003046 [Arachis hypogaea]|uniref:uncharacterized protein isoform X2 n=1 Tax=Arachis hypogaea TaxID=3818 RepID=UPI000DECB500|nr:uncharacterized protein LOC112707922 isoform X2 [Arachis hypogaea]QHO51347.1 uncharacterized protein DS421_1g30120 [Arachis hypogaea]QHO51348.1 uncharacterized protein DS421_1g30120 [Arachis hypogaea]